jgi:site-specific recombinase XerD
MQLGFELLDIYRNHLFKHGNLEATVNCYESDAKGFLEYLKKNSPRGELTGLEDLLGFQKSLEEGQESQNSIRRKIIGIKSFLRFAVSHLLHMPSGFDDFPIPPRIEELPDCLSADDIECLFNFAKLEIPMPKSYRDLAILSLISLEGLKISEIIQLKRSDLVLTSSGSLNIRGRRNRVLALSLDTSHYLKLYRDASSESLTSALFVGIKGRSSTFVSDSITRHGIKFMLYELGTACKIPYLNSELLRHFAMDYQLKVLGKSTEEVMLHFGLRQSGNVGRHTVKQLLSQEVEASLER